MYRGLYSWLVSLGILGRSGILSLLTPCLLVKTSPVCAASVAMPASTPVGRSGHPFEIPRSLRSKHHLHQSSSSYSRIREAREDRPANSTRQGLQNRPICIPVQLRSHNVASFTLCCPWICDGMLDLTTNGGRLPYPFSKADPLAQAFDEGIISLSYLLVIP